jgi:hypothetical protein
LSEQNYKNLLPDKRAGFCQDSLLIKTNAPYSKTTNLTHTLLSYLMMTRIGTSKIISKSKKTLLQKSSTKMTTLPLEKFKIDYVPDNTSQEEWKETIEDYKLFIKEVEKVFENRY